MSDIGNFMKELPAPPPNRSPGIACIIGLLFGGIGLAIYLRNVVDFVLPVLMVVVLTVLLGGDIGWIGGALFAGLYGYVRVGVYVREPDSR